MMKEALFVPGQTYRRRILHERWGGQRQGGISTPRRNNIILLFTGDADQQHGYRDEWSKDGIFFYTGGGQKGDMRYVSGNRAIRDHAGDGKDLHLFRQVRKGYVQYVWQMVCTGSGQNPPYRESEVGRAVLLAVRIPRLWFDW